MEWVKILEGASIAVGLASACCWVAAAVVKAAPPEGMKGRPDGQSWRGTIVGGGELLGTLRAQARWNSFAAFAAAFAVMLQIASKLV